MATTETRTGFRLPWAADRTSSREAEEIDGPAAVESDGGNLDGEGAVDPEASAAVESEPQQDPPAAEAITPPAEPDVQAPEAPSPAPARRPTKFMADLLKAMHAAAEQARTASLEQYRTDGQAFVEQIHARSATQAEELRRRTDEDVVAIKDWSKAEISRIREETEGRIGARRQQLDGQLERHAALIEREIEKVRTRVAAYEAEMETFFDRMLAEEDPTFFAALAAQMPEPPTLEEIDEAALDELLREPEPVTEEPVVQPVEEPTAGVEPAPEPESALAVETGTAAPAEVAADDNPAPDASAELESAMASIQAAAEAAGTDESATVESAAAEAAGTDESAADESATVEPADEPATTAEQSAAAPDEVDPRIAMLGLTPDFAAAEAEAAAAASAYSDDGFAEMGEDTVSARLAGLVLPAATEATAQPAGMVTSQVVVVGLVSVASIASFKRHLGRLEGVTHVGVSSGPDGEFVYTVSHDPSVALADLVPAIPGFGARVTGSGDGIVHVSAGDPEA